ncbi:hypothetical protein DYB25_000636 [Aphanomyces astaci]|uniref:Uncharacterized protein n=1 Tax=Aphanomyces astaci TaxID=112090 RepID=A0A397DEC1_APHAT|nr:hypothetical protein DYB25_000636 [Aphanomyces astaci]RHY60562.1 hypothetical protein DYB38_009955 [Aphanomyces astaci]
MKRSGRPLLLCEFHRAKQNSIKRKSDTKYRTDRLAQKKPPSPIAATAPATIVPLDFYSHSFTEQLGLPLGLPLGLHYDNSPTIMSMTPPPDEMIVSPTSDMGGEDIALLQFFMLHYPAISL